MPFTNAYHGPGAPEPTGLAARIEAELRARIEDAVDYACLEAMVRTRREGGGPAPAADNPQDREEYLARVLAFLQGLQLAMVRDLTAAQRARLGPVVGAPPADDIRAVLAVHVALARELPHYWQEFESFRTRHGATAGNEPSRGERRGLLDRLLDRR